MGIKILSFTIKDLKDAEGYLDAIGQEQTANIKSKATIEKAEADRDASIQEQECQKNAMDKKYQVDTSIADFEKEFKTKEVINTFYEWIFRRADNFRWIIEFTRINDFETW